MDGDSDSEGKQGSNTGALQRFFMMLEASGSGLFVGGPFVGTLGSALFQPGRNDEEVIYDAHGRPSRNPDGSIRTRVNSTSAQNTELAARAYDVVKNAAAATGVPED